MAKRYLRPDHTTVPADLVVTLVRDQANRPLYFISQIIPAT